MQISASHDPCGHILQLIAISTDPDAALGLGSELRAFALLLAKLDPTLHSVIGVTRCSDFDGDDMAKYVAAHEIGAQTDKDPWPFTRAMVLRFYVWCTSFARRMSRIGAQVCSFSVLASQKRPCFWHF